MPRCGSDKVRLLTFELEEEFSGALVEQLPPKEEWVCPSCGYRWMEVKSLVQREPTRSLAEGPPDARPPRAARSCGEGAASQGGLFLPAHGPPRLHGL